MRKRILWITRTGAMLAMLIALQWVTSFVPKPAGQLVTGTCVNAVLAVTALLCGMGSGLTVAVLSPVFAFLLGIAPNLVTVPVIMVGNSVFVWLLSRFAGNGRLWRKGLALAVAAVCKFAFMYAAVTYGICGVLAEGLLKQGLLKAPMLKMLPASFAMPQLIAALLGGGLALLIVPVLRKGIREEKA